MGGAGEGGKRPLLCAVPSYRRSIPCVTQILESEGIANSGLDRPLHLTSGERGSVRHSLMFGPLSHVRQPRKKHGDVPEGVMHGNTAACFFAKIAHESGLIGRSTAKTPGNTARISLREHTFNMSPAGDAITATNGSPQ